MVFFAAIILVLTVAISVSSAKGCNFKYYGDNE